MAELRALHSWRREAIQGRRSRECAQGRQARQDRGIEPAQAPNGRPRMDRLLAEPSFRAHAARIGAAVTAAPGPAGIEAVLRGVIRPAGSGAATAPVAATATSLTKERR